MQEPYALRNRMLPILSLAWNQTNMKEGNGQDPKRAGFRRFVSQPAEQPFFCLSPPLHSPNSAKPGTFFYLWLVMDRI